MMNQNSYEVNTISYVSQNSDFLSRNIFASRYAVDEANFEGTHQIAAIMTAPVFLRLVQDIESPFTTNTEN